MPKGLDTIIQLALSLAGAYAAAFWFCLVVWTFRDIQLRSRDVLVQVLATMIVLVFNLPGLILYLILRPSETHGEAYARTLEEESLLREIEERVTCPGCKRPVEADYIVCPTCRAQLKQPCTSCKRLLQLGWRLCPYCAADVEPEPTSLLESPRRSTGRRASFTVERELGPRVHD